MYRVVGDAGRVCDVNVKISTDLATRLTKGRQCLCARVRALCVCVCVFYLHWLHEAAGRFKPSFVGGRKNRKQTQNRRKCLPALPAGSAQPLRRLFLVVGGFLVTQRQGEKQFDSSHVTFTEGESLSLSVSWRRARRRILRPGGKPAFALGCGTRLSDFK